MNFNFKSAGILLFLSCFVLNPLFGQTKIHGKIYDKQNNPIIGANIYLKNTYDGTTSTVDGSYTFKSNQKDTVLLVVDHISFDPYEQMIELKGGDLEINIVLEESVTLLDAVTISAGMYEAGDEKKSVVLNSMDIVSTAGSGADIVSAMATLPGANIVGGRTGLYVRGGEGREAQTFIDGMRVAHPFYSSVPDISNRGRFSPFLFQGTYFSTGGYSAEYGQGLSSALILNSEGLPPNSYTMISIMDIGAGVGHNHLWKTNSLGVMANYSNLNPYARLAKQNFDWTNAATGYDASIIFRQKTSKTGLLKVYAQFDQGEIGYNRIDLLHYPDSINFTSKGNNFYSNVSYKEQLSEKLTFSGGYSYTRNDDHITDGDYQLQLIDHTHIAKGRLNYLFGKLSSVKFGGETQFMSVEDTVKRNQNYDALFAETDLFLTNRFIFRVGIRGEYSDLLEKFNLAPRASLAYKTDKSGQFSFAFGKFYQEPDQVYLYDTGLHSYEEATHYILNYQFFGDERVFRIESYYKSYDKLILYGTELSTNGYGYAKGVDLFWRDKKSVPNGDYWISYSYIDTKRKYLYYPEEVMPDYAAKHTLSVVYKQFISPLSTTLSLSYLFNSGRPYYNPNKPDFMSDRTENCHNLSVSMSWFKQLRTDFFVISVSISNILGFDNIYGYHYTPDGTNRIEIKDTSKRFFFLGLFISLGRDNTEDI
jgi:vitamin B12 transporter